MLPIEAAWLESLEVYSKKHEGLLDFAKASR